MMILKCGQLQELGKPTENYLYPNFMNSCIPFPLCLRRFSYPILKVIELDLELIIIIFFKSLIHTAQQYDRHLVLTLS